MAQRQTIQRQSFAASAFVSPLGRDIDGSENERVDDALNVVRCGRMTGCVGETDLQRELRRPGSGRLGRPMIGAKQGRSPVYANDVMVKAEKKRRADSRAPRVPTFVRILRAVLRAVAEPLRHAKTEIRSGLTPQLSASLQGAMPKD